MNEFKEVLRQLADIIHQITGIEQVKLTAAVSNHVATIEDCMTKEQALILRLRGLEQERERAQEKAGFGGMRFQEILDKVSHEEKEELLPLFGALEWEIQMFREVNEDTNRAMKVSLHMIERAINAKEGNMYGGDGQNMGMPRHMTSRRV